MTNPSLNERWHSDRWIKDIQILMTPLVQKIHKEYYQRENARSSRKNSVNKYNQSPKGQIVRKRVHALRHRRVRYFNIPPDEKEMIRQFYAQCPDGYVVDHIFPISKGGSHSLMNLQWLRPNVNAKKSNIILASLSEYPHCRLDLDTLFP